MATFLPQGAAFYQEGITFNITECTNLSLKNAHFSVGRITFLLCNRADQKYPTLAIPSLPSRSSRHRQIFSAKFNVWKPSKAKKWASESLKEQEKIATFCGTRYIVA